MYIQGISGVIITDLLKCRPRKQIFRGQRGKGITKSPHRRHYNLGEEPLFYLSIFTFSPRLELNHEPVILNRDLLGRLPDDPLVKLSDIHQPAFDELS